MTTVARTTDERRLLVWGYIRNVEKMYKSLNIPFEINDIIYLYQTLYDEWSTKYKSKDISIDADRTIVSVKTKGNITMYGREVIKKGIFTWKVKFISFPYDNGYPLVGIVENDDSMLQRFVNNVDFDEFGYLLCAGGGDLYAFDDFTGNQQNCIWNTDDSILEMELDLANQTLSFKVDDGDFVEAFTDVKLSPKGYRFALSVSNCLESKFQLVE